MLQTSKKQLFSLRNILEIRGEIMASNNNNKGDENTTKEADKQAKPRFVFVLSGKRKCGKDYVAEQMVKRLGEDKSVIIRLSGPLKYQYALEHDLDYEKLLDASSYKEKYREDMIIWGEKQRNRDPGYFCRHAIKGIKEVKGEIEKEGVVGQKSTKEVWIVSDARRITDVAFFIDHYGDRVKTVRVQADDDVRKVRGWKFTAGVDDAESECGLDDYQKWDFLIQNDGNDNENIENFFKQIHSLI